MMLLIKKFIIAALILLNTQIAFCQRVEWTSSTNKDRWVNNKDLALNPLPVDLPCDAQIMPNNVQQQIDGWGGCFNELGWDALQLLNTDDRDKVLRSFFGSNGLKYSICRMPIGANDYARDWYSLDDTPLDFPLTNFNINRDLTTLILYKSSDEISACA